jgi:DNA gyrase subunit B
MLCFGLWTTPKNGVANPLLEARKMSSKVDVYSLDSIQVLSGLEAVRRRPGMYIGDVHDGSGLHYMLWEVLSNALDEHLAGRARRVRVSVEGQLAEVEDDGGGMSLAPHPNSGVPFVELALTTLHCGATLDGHFPHVHIGPTGLGLAVVNALSESLEIEVRQGGWSWHQRFARGARLGPIERGARTERTGTRVRFRPDASIFGPTPFDRAKVRDRLRDLAAFNPALTFELMAEKIHEPRGLTALASALACDGPLADTFAMRSLKDDVLVEVALGWREWPIALVRSFVGQQETEDGGTHESGFFKGLAAAIAAQPACAGRMPRGVARARQRLGGLHAIVHVDLRHPQFGAPTRARLVDRGVQAIVRQRVEEAYTAHLRDDPQLAPRLLRHLSQ